MTDRFGEPAGARHRVHLCFGPNCSERGSRQLWPKLEQAIDEAGLTGDVELLATTCRNRCDYGPSLNVYPGPTFYNGVDADAIQEIVRDHLGSGHVCRRWVFRPTLTRS
ncbi:MAG: (2Fe-2S) ferredoxin domain-containing protein [Thermomicrobiales bacterium]|nr:(2Fe-2S) ferredoxin domain-containing protein [Thermomicrobiales bacterium]